MEISFLVKVKENNIRVFSATDSCFEECSIKTLLDVFQHAYDGKESKKK